MSYRYYSHHCFESHSGYCHVYYSITIMSHIVTHVMSVLFPSLSWVTYWAVSWPYHSHCYHESHIKPCRDCTVPIAIMSHILSRVMTVPFPLLSWVTYWAISWPYRSHCYHESHIEPYHDRTIPIAIMSHILSRVMAVLFPLLSWVTNWALPLSLSHIMSCDMSLPLPSLTLGPPICYRNKFAPC